MTNELEMTEEQFEIALDILHKNADLRKDHNYCNACGDGFASWINKNGPTWSFAVRHNKTKKHQQALHRREVVREMLERIGLLDAFMKSCRGGLRYAAPTPQCVELFKTIKERWKIELAASEAAPSQKPPRGI